MLTLKKKKKKKKKKKTLNCFGWNSGFREIDDSPRVHLDETEFRLSSCSVSPTIDILVPLCTSAGAIPYQIAKMLHWTKDTTSTVILDLFINAFIYNDIICHIVTVTKWIKSCLLPWFGTFKMPILMFISILVFRPEGQIWNPVMRDTKIYVQRILNASRISKTQLNSSTISPS